MDKKRVSKSESAKLKDSISNGVKGGGKSIGIIGLFVILLTLLFIYLRLTDQINWSWFWVVSPILAYLCYSTCCVTVLLVVLAVAFVVWLAYNKFIEE